MSRQAGRSTGLAVCTHAQAQARARARARVRSEWSATRPARSALHMHYLHGNAEPGSAATPAAVATSITGISTAGTANNASTGTTTSTGARKGTSRPAHGHANSFPSSQGTPQPQPRPRPQLQPQPRRPAHLQMTQPQSHTRLLHPRTFSRAQAQARRIVQTLSPLSPAVASIPTSTSRVSAPPCPSTAAVYTTSNPLHRPACSSSTVDPASAVARVRCVLLHPSPIRGHIRTLPSVMGSALKQTRDHGDHGHGHGHHHHHHDSTYLTSANRNDPGVRITRIGLVSNLGMAIAKFVGGWAFNSKSMTADAWHSIADLASDILTLATVSWSLKPPTDRFPVGFGKVESLGSLGVSGMLLVGGFYMGWESAISLYGHFNPEGAHHIFEHLGHGHSHSHSPSDLGIPNIHAVWLAAGTILVKEWLYQATMKVARERKSSVLASNAVHHRVDSLTGIVTLAAILGANVVENAAWLDPVGGLLISIMVVKAGYDNTKEALYELADRSLDADVKNSVRKQARRALSNVSEGHEAELRDVSGTKSGQNYLVDMELAVPGAWTVDDVKDLEDAVRMQVGGKVRGVKRLRVRFVSRDKAVDEKFDEFIPGPEALQRPELEQEEEAEEEEKAENGAADDKDGKHRHH
ncbi:Cation efflux protein [Metarhizium album ARSEF 1941]|uniref:Cation efflux protein n=1 Tax=Metarhizium album (strain ARSEF 1941) TaxID=1081103 RepID=A0A0B2X5H3_METAS|nr:Cation efflux protein [Metarhizium album ARSEF 1941]KHO00700.1 Cation efflux protein [Metarhizium album ARSEF 1941]